MKDPLTTGVLVQQALEKGRAAAIAKARDEGAHNADKVRVALDKDILAGHGDRGRAGRIAKMVRGHVRVRAGIEVRNFISPRGVRKILERLSSGSASVSSNSCHENESS
jgi:hypothetical protein